MSTFRYLFAITLLFFSLSTLAQHKNVSVSPIPQWVQDVQPNLTAKQPDEEATGYYYLFLDDQSYLKDEEFYSRYTYKILNTKGVQDMGDLNINFDPEYQTVQLHNINIVRNGKIIEKLDLNHLKVIQMETNWERFLYDGRLTIIANLTDVRVGDIIDYSFTIKGSNPVYLGNYQTSFALQFNLPVQKIHYSITVPQKESIKFRKLNNAPDPVVTQTPNGKQYTWQEENVQPVNYEFQVPAWFDPAPSIEITQFNSWKDVVDQFQKYYALTPAERKILDQKFQVLLNSDEEGGEFIDQAIRFVQDEVRYLGFENGMNSHKPSDPRDVLERRYGDCKDKSFLLSEILQARGLDAYPMLVHSTNGKNLDTNLPSPDIFDHCVVEIDLGNKNFRYIDPTISYQGGTIENIHFPDYGFGLVLKPGENSLRKLPEFIGGSTDITETYELDDIVDRGAIMEVKTIYRGTQGDSQRWEFAQNSRQSILEEYTVFYRNFYPSIKAEGNLVVEDNREENEFIVYEKYRIDSIWENSVDDKNIILAEFHPLSLRTYLFPEISSGRKMPYELFRPVDITHKTIVFVPEAFNLDKEEFSVKNDNFQYDYKTNYKNAKLEITHQYKSLSTFLEPDDIGNYLDEHVKAQQKLSYVLTYNIALASAMATSDTSWWSIFLTLIVMTGAGYLAFRIYNEYDIPSKTKPNWEKSIGGWLVLFAIGVALNPLIIISEFFGEGGYFDKSLWYYLWSSQENYPIAFLMLFELIYNSAYFIFSVLILVLFFKRRSIAPRIIIIFMAVTLFITIVDSLLGVFLRPIPLTGPEKQELLLEITKRVIQSLIWIPYFIYSTRVEETFTKTRRPPLEEEITGELSTILPAE